jgi:sterol 24-C-methyltransferase
VVDYYDLVTDLYEFGWGQCFHFAVRRRGDSFRRATEAHEAWLGREAELAPGRRDLGCGVGGPMRFLARTTGAHVTGVNVNRGQIARARARAASEGLRDRITVLESDFSTLPFPDRTFDAVYAIEATCHAPDRGKVFAEALRVLVPGGRFVGYEWCTTHAFEPSNPAHARVIAEIEDGNALPPLGPTTRVDLELRAAGFDLRGACDVAGDCELSTPWWMSLSGEGGLRALPRTTLGRRATERIVPFLERSGLAPRGTVEASRVLNRAADALVAGGRLGIFTPMYRWSAVRPRE